MFMNKARLYKNRFTKETKQFLDEVKEVAEELNEKGFKVHLCRAYIPERAAIRQAMNFIRSLPSDFQYYFDNLWNEIKDVLKA